MSDCRFCEWYNPVDPSEKGDFSQRVQNAILREQFRTNHLLEHLIEAGPRHHVCGVCGASFVTEPEIRQHLEWHGTKKVVP